MLSQNVHVNMHVFVCVRVSTVVGERGKIKNKKKNIFV